ncbi:MAG: hypothetical protein RMJ28_01075 [Nitrososphaerota archaeon]|nr:hypothetical protein [Candidatus Calditenuaceae archaeon]MDW8072824.1 hypothetical protein [Nitrososphaerota archaeon]
MGADRKAAVRAILEKEGTSPEFTAAADILRAMVILYGAGWESDVLDVLSGVWSLKNLSLESIADLRKRLPGAVKILEESRLVTVETRLRPYLEEAKPVEERFYSALDLPTLLRALVSDRYIDRYRFEVSGWTRPPKQ